MLRIPNLFIIGAMKSGTSSLAMYLGNHPSIFMSPVKEPMHFSRKENWSKGNEAYLELFSGVRDEGYICEASTEYTKRPHYNGVARRLFKFNPSAKFIYVMRDPFARIVSQYKHMVKMQMEERKLSQIIKQRSGYLMNSSYAYQIRPYLEYFGRDALYLDTFESMIKSPEQFCRRIFSWLDIDTHFELPNIRERYHASPSKVEMINKDSAMYKVLHHAEQLPVLKHLLKKKLRRLLLKQVDKTKVIDFTSTEFHNDVDTTRQIVAPTLTEWIIELSEITGASYEAWPSSKK